MFFVTGSNGTMASWRITITEPIFSESLRVARQSRPVPFLDKSIVFEFSCGVSKAELVRTGGKLLGQIGRDGASPDPERDQKQQFLCESWLCTGTFQLSLGAVPKCWLGIIYIYIYTTYIYIYL